MDEALNIGARDAIACVCEGSSEQTVVEILLDRESLIFSRSQLIDRSAIPTRFYKHSGEFSEEYLMRDYSGTRLVVLVIQDRDKHVFKIPDAYKKKIWLHEIVVTSPELEMLMVHSLGLYDDYKKQKKKPSVFVSEMNGIRVSKLKSKEFIRKFYDGEGRRIEDAIMEHNAKSKKPSEGIFLADLLT